MSQNSRPQHFQRYPLNWQDEDFYDEQNLDEEMRRVFDICHGCRKCFNLCDSFPKLFDLVDESKTGELDSVDSKDFSAVTDACTLCDMCFVHKCPYVPPHEFDIDFPRLMLRAKAVKYKKEGTPFAKDQLLQVDRNGSLGTKISGMANWVIQEDNTLSRKVIEKTTQIHHKAALPPFSKGTFVSQAKKHPLSPNEKAPGFGEKVVLYATCFGNYHKTSLAQAAYKILAHNGVHAEVVYPECCGMPLLEEGRIEKVAEGAKRIAATFLPWVRKGYKILSLVPSCTLMLKQEWPLILPHEVEVMEVSKHTMDISDYLVTLFKEKGMIPGLSSLGEDITLHLACHSRAQNVGQKAADLLRLIPETKIEVIERCSGHGGTWGMMVDHFETALKIGTPVFKQAIKNNNAYVASECPLADMHIQQGMERQGNYVPSQFKHAHPLEIFAHAYGLIDLEKENS